MQPFMPNKADTCRTFVVPKLQAADWDADPHSIAEQRTFTDGYFGNTRLDRCVSLAFIGGRDRYMRATACGARCRRKGSKGAA